MSKRRSSSEGSDASPLPSDLPPDHSPAALPPPQAAPPPPPPSTTPLVALPPPPTPPGVDPSSLLCPGCAFPFRAAPSPCAPSTFDSCGHSLCGDCADAVTMVPSPRCPVCGADVKARVVNVALGELGEAMWSVAQSASPAPVSSDGGGGEGCCVPAAARAPASCANHTVSPLTHFCVTDSTLICAVCVLEGHAGHGHVTVESGWCEGRLRESAALLTPAAEAMMRGVAVVDESKAALAAVKSSVIKEIEAEIDALFVRLFAHRADMVKRVEAEYCERVKALEAQADELAVTAAQLRAAAQVAAEALALPPLAFALGVARAYECVSAMSRLMTLPTRKVEWKPAPLLTALDTLATVVTENALQAVVQVLRQEAQLAADAAVLLVNDVQGLGGSVILASVAPDRITAFLRELAGWLPDRAYTLLYRGSRDGMTAGAFHGMCDDKGPTLVLVRSEGGFVFGGYAGASWESTPSQLIVVMCAHAFLFSVTSPYTTAAVRFPLRAGRNKGHLYCTPSHGPTFAGGLRVNSWVPSSPSARFDARGCQCELGPISCYEDTLKKGVCTFTGAEHFTPVEMEVYAVAPT